MARLKKRKDGRYQRKVTLSNGKQKFVYGKTIAEVNAAANALMNQDLEQAGFCQIQSHKNRKGWLCVTAQKR